MNRRYRLLLVEDNPDHVEITTEILKPRGFDVFAALRMGDAMKMIASSEFDVAILDYNLPDGKGIDLLEKMRSMGMTIPIIFVSGTDDPSLSIKIKRSGATDYVVKTYDYYVRLPGILLDLIEG